MFAVTVRYPAIREHLATFLPLLEKSLEITGTQPGFVGYQLFAPFANVDMRICLMFWESSEAFQAFVQSETCERAHADIQPDFFTEEPTMEEMEVLSTFNAPNAMA